MKDQRPRLKPIQFAGMLPRDPRFRAFISQWMVPPREPTVDEAAHFIRVACQIESRRELATNREAAHRLQRFICRPFAEWQEQQHQPA
ncbi:hypothetical protein H3V53_06245 [Paraburkholderia bengalensis]|uniref:Uncharacterized protein n=1 Tax=Paraburkholderia bengalensis TaxID=2747562 RepID=A0ABU8INB7_9BURK